MMNRRDFLRGSAAALLAPNLSAARKPNVILIVADDLGYAGIGVQGCDDIPTPHIDSIARNGVRFTNGYVSCPVCSPTRAGLITGRYQQRFGHEFNPGPAAQASDNFGLPLNEVTLADRMKSLGYATGMVGKWHLGYRKEFLPPKRGFDEFFGFPGGAHSYLNSRERDRDGNPVMRGMEEVEEKEYLTDALGREAAAFMERRKNAPYFLYLPFNAVHAPMEAVQRYESRFTSITDSRRRTHAAMMAAMDDAIGKVLAKVREHKQEEDTLIFFISDNGGPTAQTTSKNTPLRGFKGQVLEGGIRVPFLMQWKGHVPAGRVYDKPVIALDIHPTAVAAAGGKAPALDGVDLVPHVHGKTASDPHDRLYWRFGPQAAVRKGDWKLLNTGDGDWQLYNLRQDISETKNLASAESAKAQELKTDWEAWNRELKPPAWRTERQGKKGKKKRA
ncbi:MAG: sulfatase-like hydrolase/transferase [Bryobacterales bacterium]|nr:sulfatase-like hydrolase/transferase [Bryobacterales bacterium]